MKSLLLTLLFACSICLVSFGQPMGLKDFEPNTANPYGRPNPEMPGAFMDFDPMIGTCNCKSLQRNPDGTWPDTLTMEWKFKYIMNGTAVQDEVWREGNFYAGSIRQYQQDSAKWVVTYFGYPFVSTKPGTWLGSKTEKGPIVLKMAQKAPNGMDGVSRLTFYDITKEGYNWIGEWVSPDGSIVYPFWQIWCRKVE